jgi:hypothetical protein
MDFVCDTNALIEADEVSAAAKENVLTVIDDFIDAGVQIG